MSFLKYIRRGLVMTGFENMKHMNDEMARTMIEVAREYDRDR
ncbi:hypothetical protein [Bifidobacterium santillanense]|nr:hypothetical protein [Bifidobacterium santillanense]